MTDKPHIKSFRGTRADTDLINFTNKLTTWIIASYSGKVGSPERHIKIAYIKP